MELNKELVDIKLQEKTVKDVIAELKEQRSELDKKIHIFKVMEIANVLEDMVRDKMFEQYGIQEIEVSHDYDYEIGNEVNFKCYEADGSQIEEYDYKGNYIEPVSVLKNLFTILEGFDGSYINENFSSNSAKYLKAQESIKDQLMSLFISSELKATLEHEQLKINLPEDKKEFPKKRKI